MVVYYSLSGNTRRLAETVAEVLRRHVEVDVEELVEIGTREGVVRGFLGTGRDALLRRKAAVIPIRSDLSNYDLVLVGTPVWAWSMCGAVRSFLHMHASGLKQVAFFLTTGGVGIERTFKRMEEMCGKAPLATLGVTERELKRFEGVQARVETFVEQLVAAGGAD